MSLIQQRIKAKVHMGSIYMGVVVTAIAYKFI